MQGSSLHSGTPGRPAGGSPTLRGVRSACRLGLGCAFLLLAAGLLAGRTAEAGGVQIQENGARQLGNANAGGSAAVEDASTVWWNPAGLAHLQRPELVASGHVILPDAEFTDLGTTNAAGLPRGGTAGVADDGIFVPNLFAGMRLNRSWAIGLGINAPFGLRTDYDETWVGRYEATESELRVININPSVAFRPNRQWSFGAGVNVQYVEATLANAVDFGAALAQPGAADGLLSLEGDGWTLGFNVGVLWEPCCGTRFGLTYRSQTTADLEGDAEFTVPANAAPVLAGGRFVNTGIKTSVTLPDVVSLSAYHQLTPRWAVMGDVTWTNWSTFDEVVIEFDNPVEPDQRLEFDWEDAWRFSFGVTWKPNRRWTLRGGVAFDQSPIPDRTRTPRIPGNDRIWLALGAGYRFNRCFALDVAWAHIFVEDGDVDQSDPSRGRLLGRFESQVDVFAVQVTWTR